MNIQINCLNKTYLSDMNRTPLGALADFVAENRLRLKDMERKEILIEFYDTEALL